MSSYVKYSMYGFNRKHKAELDGNHFEYTLSNNLPYVYHNHLFLESVYINENITEITFYLQPGKSCEKYMNEISNELEKICFNLITHSELPIIQPYCLCEIAVNEDGSKVQVNDYVNIHDECFLFKKIDAKSIYEEGIENKTNFEKCGAKYKELFWILHSPHKVIQFMGLYDIMAELICNPISQKKVHDFFGKNRKKYPFITFVASEKDVNKNEDSLTHLRNAIAHSKQIGVTEFLNISNNISDMHIKQLLIVINDLLCNE
ncbi:MAG: hypothetical protein ACLS8T_14395 [Anaerobutyricum sp.]|jgi:hypothetical protein